MCTVCVCVSERGGEGGKEGVMERGRAGVIEWE